MPAIGKPNALGTPGPLRAHIIEDAAKVLRTKFESSNCLIDTLRHVANKNTGCCGNRSQRKLTQ